MDNRLKTILLWVAIGIGGLIVLGIVNPFYVVNPGERAVTITLGNLSNSIQKEGLGLRLPLAQSVYTVSIKQQVVEGHSPAYSSDLQNMDVSFKVIYQIPESTVLDIFRKYQGDIYDSFVEPRIQEAIKTVSARYTAENFVKRREAVKSEILALLQRDLRHVVVVFDMPITNIDLSDELEKAIEVKQIKEQEALAKRYELEKAQKDAEITVVKAEAEAKAMRITGDALRATPQLASLKAIEKWNGIGPVVSGGGNMIFDVSRATSAH